MTAWFLNKEKETVMPTRNGNSSVNENEVVDLPYPDPAPDEEVRWLRDREADLNAGGIQDFTLLRTLRAFVEGPIHNAFEAFRAETDLRTVIEKNQKRFFNEASQLGFEIGDSMDISATDMRDAVDDDLYERESRVRSKHRTGVLLTLAKFLLEGGLAMMFVSQAIHAIGLGVGPIMTFVALAMSFFIAAVVHAILLAWVTASNAVFKNQGGTNLLARRDGDTALISALKATQHHATISDTGRALAFAALTLLVAGIAWSWLQVDSYTFTVMGMPAGVAQSMGLTITLLLLGIGVTSSQKFLDSAYTSDQVHLYKVNLLRQFGAMISEQFEAEAKLADWESVTKRKDWAFGELAALAQVLPRADNPIVAARVIDHLRDLLLPPKIRELTNDLIYGPSSTPMPKAF